MIFQWKNKAIWLALTGSAVCLGFLGCSKPGGSGTSGNGGNTPADGGVVVTATPVQNIIVTKTETANYLNVPITFKSNKSDSILNRQLNVDSSKLPRGWTISSGDSFCSAIKYNSGECIIPLMLDQSAVTSGPITFQVPASLSNESGAKVEPLFITYFVNDPSSKSAVVGKVTSPTGTITGNVNSGSQSIVINFQANQAGVSRFSYYSISDKNNNWSFKESSIGCSNEISTSDSECNVTLNFNPIKFTNGQTSLDFSYFYMLNGTKTGGIISIPYSVTDPNKSMVSGGGTYSISTVMGDSTKNSVTVTLKSDREILGSLSIGDLPPEFETPIMSTDCNKMIDSSGSCSVIFKIKTNNEITQKSFIIPFSFSNDQAIFNDTHISYAVYARPQIQVTSDPISFDSINNADMYYNIVVKAYTNAVFPGLKVSLGAQTKPVSDLDMTVLSRDKACDNLPSGQWCKITIKGFNPSKVTNLEGSLVIPLESVSNADSPKSIKIPYSISKKQPHKIQVRADFNKNIKGIYSLIFDATIKKSDSGKEVHDTITIKKSENQKLLPMKTQVYQGDIYTIELNPSSTSGISCKFADQNGTISDNDMTIIATCDPTP